MSLVVSRDITVQRLRDVALFGELADNLPALTAVAAMLEIRIFSPGAQMIVELTPGNEMFVLYEGRAAVWKRTLEGDRYKVAILKGEDHAVFGEGGLIASEERSATIQAETECHCYVLARDAFERLGAEHPEWALPILHEIARTLMKRLRSTSRDFAMVYHALVEEVRGTRA